MIKLHSTSFSKSIEPELWNKSVQPIQSFVDSMQIEIKVIFVYGDDYPRSNSGFVASRFWESLSFWVLFIAFFMATLALFFLRRQTSLQRESFSYCLFVMYCTVIGNGKFRIYNGLEKIFFSAALITAFFFVSLCLAQYSMHSLLDTRPKVGSFEELSKRNVPFYINGFFADQIDAITDMLRYFIGSKFRTKNSRDDLYFCSKKLNKHQHIEFEGSDGRMLAAESDSEKGLAIILADSAIGYTTSILSNRAKDFDVITEPLGNFICFNINYCLL